MVLGALNSFPVDRYPLYILHCHSFCISASICLSTHLFLCTLWSVCSVPPVLWISNGFDRFAVLYYFIPLNTIRISYKDCFGISRGMTQCLSTWSEKYKDLLLCSLTCTVDYGCLLYSVRSNLCTHSQKRTKMIKDRAVCVIICQCCIRSRFIAKYTIKISEKPSKCVLIWKEK